MTLKKFKNIRIVAVAENGVELLEKVEKFRPNVVITDICMPFMDGFEVTRRIRNDFPEIEVIAIAMNNEDNIILDMLETGAKGYIMKKASSKEFVEAIEKVNNKEIHYCKISANKVVRNIHRSKLHPFKNHPKPTFTPYELKIIKLTCQELSAKEIANQINSNENNINSARERIRSKMEVKSVAGMVVYAMRQKLYSID